MRLGLDVTPLHLGPDVTHVRLGLDVTPMCLTLEDTQVEDHPGVEGEQLGLHDGVGEEGEEGVALGEGEAVEEERGGGAVAGLRVGGDGGLPGPALAPFVQGGTEHDRPPVCLSLDKPQVRCSQREIKAFFFG